MPTQAPEQDPARREYTRDAARYDRRWARYVERSTDATLARLSLTATDRVLDIGCGTGALLERLTRSIEPHRLTGVDLTPAMLAVAHDRLPDGVALHTARAEALPFDDHAFDVVISCSVFHFIHDPAAALREIHRVLRPDGRVVITDWCRDYLACRILERWLRLARRPHHRIHASAELAELLRASGFTRIVPARYRIDWWWGLMTLTGRTTP